MGNLTGKRGLFKNKAEGVPAYRVPKYTAKHLRDKLAELRSFTFVCRNDMHEPDSIWKVKLTKGNIDNAFGGAFSEEHPERHLVLHSRDGRVLDINLCDLIALARMADVKELSKES